MTKKGNPKKELVLKRISNKIALLKEYPNAWLYTFENLLVRDSFLRPIRQIDMAYIQIMELWGYQIDDEKKENAEKIYKETILKAQEIVDFIEKSGVITNFDFMHKITNERLYEKEKHLRETRKVVELLIPLEKESEIFYQLLVYMDKFDIPLKKQFGKEWITKTMELKNFIETARNQLFDLLKEVDIKYISKFKALQKEIKKLQNNQ